MPIASSTNQQSTTDLQELAQAEGQKLGFLIAKSPVLTVEEKEALLNVVPEMDNEQLQQLTAVLEAQFVNAASPDIDAATVAKLQTAEAEYDVAVAGAEESVLNELNKIQTELE